MSTRANIVVTNDSNEELWFYRHSDGYPEGTMPLLEKFLGYIKKGKIRDNIEQASGWLIALGHKEYNVSIESLNEEDSFRNWKVGSIEPSVGQHEDIEYLYTIDLSKKTIEVKSI